MWTVFKYRKNYNFLISNLKEKLSDSAIFYNPRVEYSSVIRNKKKIKTKYQKPYLKKDHLKILLY